MAFPLKPEGEMGIQRTARLRYDPNTSGGTLETSANCSLCHGSVTAGGINLTDMPYPWLRGRVAVKSVISGRSPPESDGEETSADHRHHRSRWILSG